MATIVISDELHRKLMDLATNASLQDNRATASPYFYQIKETVQIDGVDESFSYDGELLRDGDGSLCELDRDSMIQELTNCGVDIDFTMRKDHELRSMLEDDHGYYSVFYRNEEKFTGAFLTEKSCREHIRLNAYHYNNPVDYLQHAWRNPDMEIIAQLLKELVHPTVIIETRNYVSISLNAAASHVKSLP